MSSELLQAALRYAALDEWAVFPCNPDKSPKTPNGLDDATRDADKIKAWWLKWPNASIGINLGLSGLIVVDVDGPAALEALAALKLPATLQVTTGRGTHHYYTSPSGCDLRSGKLAAELDLKAAGGYVIAPPSVHASGAVYESNGADIRMLDDAAVLRLKARSRPAGKALAVGEQIPAGERNSTLARLAGTMRRPGMDEAAILAALLVENATRCNPPLPEEEVAAIARSVGRYEPSEKPAATPAPQVVRLYFQDDLDDVPEPEWLRQDELPKGETGILFGPWGSRKSLLALHWGCEAAQDHGLVVYVTPEGFSGLKLRFAAWRQHHGVKRVERIAFVRHAVQMRDPKDVAALAAAIDQARGDEPVALIIVDTLARANAGGSENDAETMTAWLHQADALRLAFGTACTLLVIHHDGNEKGRPRGSSSIAQWVTFMLSIEAKGDTSELLVEKVKDSDRIRVVYQQVKVGHSVIVEEIERGLRDDTPGAASRRGPGVSALNFAGWLAECGGAAQLQHAGIQFNTTGRTIRRWCLDSAFRAQGIRVTDGQVVIASSAYPNGRPDAF